MATLRFPRGRGGGRRAARLALAVGGLIGAAALLSACETPNHTLIVTTAADGPDATPGDGVCEMTTDAGDCSLRAAIDESNASTDIELVTFAAGIDPALALPGDDEDANTTGDLDITDGLTIDGLRPDGGAARIDANDLDRVFDLHGDADPATTLWVNIRNLTIAGGFTDTTGGAGVRVGDGVALDVQRSLLSDSTTDSDGGAVTVVTGGSLNLVNSTISGNSAAGTGGAIHSAGTTTLNSATITANSSGSGGALHGQAGAFTVARSIVDDCSGTITSAGYNLETFDTCGFAAVGDQPNADARLGPLADNGGPTLTHAVNPGASTARDAIPVGTHCATSDVDQRGVARPQGGACDIGAVESELLEPLPLGGPAATLGNDPVEGTFPGRWLLTYGTDSPKGQGDRFQSWNCTGGALMGCDGGANAEYLEDGYVFEARVPGAGTDDTVVQVFDPLFYDYANNCNGGWLPSATFPSGVLPAFYGTNFAGQPVGRFARGSTHQWCAGDSDGGATRPNLTFLVREPSPTPSDPLGGDVVCAASYGSAQIIDGPDTGTTANQEADFRDLLLGTTIVEANNFNDYGPTVHIQDGGTVGDTDLTFERAWRRWVDLCRIPAANVVPGDYVIQVRTNADPADPTQALDPPGAKGNQRYALRLGTDNGLDDLLGSDLLDQDGYQLTARHHLPVFVNEATTNETSVPLVRVPSEHAGRTVRFEAYDITDGGAIIDLDIRPPVDSGLTAFADCQFARVADAAGRVPVTATFGGTSSSPPGLIAGETCAMGAGNATFNGALLTADIAIPDDYTCNGADPTGCWFTLHIRYGSSPQDSNVWTAGVWDPPSTEAP